MQDDPQEGEKGAEMADESQSQPRTFTQEEVNEMMGRVRREVSGRYADYDALKEKAGKYDEAQQAAKTELERATERAARAEAEAATLRAQKERADIAAKVSAATGVPATLIQGADEEAMTASANAIAAFAKAQAPQAPQDKGGAAGSPKPLGDEEISKIGDPNARVMAYARGYKAQ